MIEGLLFSRMGEDKEVGGGEEGRETGMERVVDIGGPGGKGISALACV